MKTLRTAQLLMEARAERDQAIAERDALREAAGAFLAKTQEVHVCHRCAKIATKRIWLKPGSSWFSCDDHAGDCHREDLPHAASLRTLRQLLGDAP